MGVWCLGFGARGLCWEGRRLAGRAGARLRQPGQKGLIVGAREGCLLLRSSGHSWLMRHNIGGQQELGRWERV